MIIDVHTHAFPDRIASKAIAKLQQGSHTASFSDGTQTGLQASMKRAGVDLSIVLPVATDERQVPHINDASIALNESEETIGLLSFGAMHPDYADWKRELQRLRAAGVPGIKLHPPYQNVDLDDLRYLRILDCAGELGLLVTVHAGLDVGLPGVRRAMPEMVLNALRQVGPVRLTLAHMGGWRCWDAVYELLSETDVFLDTSFSLGKMTPSGDGVLSTEDELRLMTGNQFVQMVHRFGAGRILFGSDSPWSDQKSEIRKIVELRLTTAEQAAILGGNAAALLGRAGQERSRNG